jgi:16S rRNA uridine-516 pseudouridylate synthase and related pseudouridylate synthases
MMCEWMEIRFISLETNVYIALNKPVGITSTTEKDVPGNIADFVNHPFRVFHIGGWIKIRTV